MRNLPLGVSGMRLAEGQLDRHVRAYGYNRCIRGSWGRGTIDLDDLLPLFAVTWHVVVSITTDGLSVSTMHAFDPVPEFDTWLKLPSGCRVPYTTPTPSN